MLIFRMPVNSQRSHVNKNFISLDPVSEHWMSLWWHYDQISKLTSIEQRTEVSFIKRSIFQSVGQVKRLFEISLDVLDQRLFDRTATFWLIDVGNQVVIDQVYFAFGSGSWKIQSAGITAKFYNIFDIQVVYRLRNGIEWNDIVSWWHNQNFDSRLDLLHSCLQSFDYLCGLIFERVIQSTVLDMLVMLT